MNNRSDEMKRTKIYEQGKTNHRCLRKRMANHRYLNTRVNEQEIVNKVVYETEKKKYCSYFLLLTNQGHLNKLFKYP